MKKKICLLLTALALLTSHVLALSNVFAIDTYVEPKISLRVNGLLNDRIKTGQSLEFVAKLSGDYLPTQLITWSWDLGAGEQTQTTSIANNGTSTLILNYSDISTAASQQNHIMKAEYSDSTASTSARVLFGVLDDNPAVIFTEPEFDTTISINDPIHLKIKTFMGTSSSSLTVKWTCTGGHLSPGYTCPANNIYEADISFNQVGTYKISVEAEDNISNKGRNEIIINVVNDPPKIEVQTDKNPNNYKTGDTAKAKVSVDDTYGTINKIEWGCNEGSVISFDKSYTTNLPVKSIEDYEVNLPLPNTATDNYQCKFRATDDDGEQGFYTIIFKVSAPDPIINPDPIDPTDNNTEANTTIEPSASPDVTSPDTGTMTREDNSATKNLILLIIPTLSVLVIVIIHKKTHSI